ncbi:MAG: NAD(P)H-dependent oxidoreductase [Deltaproteobacteria bacterium]|nr:NAD(P)H-dependent oxidoreductase [Deltaproteobacteria bacterium]
MFVLGLQGSPRKNGNTDYLLSLFMQEARRLGAEIDTIQVGQKNIVPCKEYTVCEKKGYCPIEDDMTHEIYPLLRRADVIVAATPIFFYNAPAQLKALIDRSQTLWARRYKLKLEDPARKWRKGFLLALGATKGERLFEGISLTTKYFFDAVGAAFVGSLTYRRVEKRGDMKKHPTVAADATQAAQDLLQPMINRKRILFACRENACRSQMAAAFATSMAGDRFDVTSAGSAPAPDINAYMVNVMQEKNIDMAFRVPQMIDAVISKNKPEIIVTMGCEVECPFVPGAQKIDWDIPDPAGKPIEQMRLVRDEIEKKVTRLIGEIT